jgi:transcriptional regulator with XRE-family HTH domain
MSHEKTDGVQPMTEERVGRDLPNDAQRLIGLLLGDAREEARLPQSAAAKALGVAQSRIAKLELGQRQLIFIEALTLCDLYGVALDRLDPRRNEPRSRDGRRQRVDLPRARRAKSE